VICHPRAPGAALERIWHIYDSQGQMMALAFRPTSFQPFHSEVAPEYKAVKRNLNLNLDSGVEGAAEQGEEPREVAGASGQGLRAGAGTSASPGENQDEHSMLACSSSLQCPFFIFITLIELSDTKVYWP